MRDSTNTTGGDGEVVACCEECLACGDVNMILRICLSCGHVGCAEGSPRDHAAEHYAETDHAVAAAIGAELAPRWSYPDERPV